MLVKWTLLSLSLVKPSPSFHLSCSYIICLWSHRCLPSPSPSPSLSFQPGFCLFPSQSNSSSIHASSISPRALHTVHNSLSLSHSPSLHSLYVFLFRFLVSRCTDCSSLSPFRRTFSYLHFSSAPLFLASRVDLAINYCTHRHTHSRSSTNALWVLNE